MTPGTDGAWASVLFGQFGLSAGQGHFQEPARGAFRSNLRTENRGAKAQVKTEVKMEQPWPFAALFWALVLFFAGRSFCVNHISFGFHLVFTKVFT